MPVNSGTLKTLEIQASDRFLLGLQSMTPSVFRRFTDVIKMNSKTIELPILGQVDELREWIGPRLIETLDAKNHSITAKKYEKTIKIPREAVEDDNVGIWMKQLETLGRMTDALPEQQIMKKLAAGETDLCYDGLPFFSASHPVGDGTTFSNLGANAGSSDPVWYLFDTSKSIMPMVWGDRIAPEYAAFWDPKDPRVFWFDEYVQGVRLRGVPDYGFPQFAYKVRGPVDSATFNAAVVAMASITNGAKQNLGVRPTLALLPTALEPAAKQLWGRQTLANGADNTDYKAIEFAITPHLSNATV